MSRKKTGGRASEAVQEPIAIIGMACRFPGAENLEAYWRLLRDGVDAVTEIPAERFDVDSVYDARPATPGKIYTRHGGFLEAVDGFDARFFGISPREASRMDPQQRLLLEVTWEAVEDAGLVPDSLVGSGAGVFVGISYEDYRDLGFRDPPRIDLYATTGGIRSVASGRLSFAFGLEGPSVTIDTACSSSLVALHLACQSLRAGECDLAFVGGANLVLHPEFSIGFAQGRMLAPDGRCKAFDARADGFVRSEGVGVVALEPLARARENGDPVRAVILGSAVGNDGRSSGLLRTPGRGGQERVLREAYRNAGVPPGQVDYVEAHGTGTRAGDPVEASALGSVLAAGRPPERPCRIGSVKSNIGHTEGAAGIAGLIKAALALEHRLLPPSLHCHEPNPEIPWPELPLRVQRELEPWPVREEPARAGVSSFGISGTNAHVVLAAAGDDAPAPGRRDASASRQPASRQPAQVLPLSAHTPAALGQLARAYRELLAEGDGEPAPLRDLCYTAALRRAHHEHRLAVVARNAQELAGQLEAFCAGETRPGMTAGRCRGGRPRVVFVFPGQGSQWLGMGRELREREPVFKAALERCDEAVRRWTGWSVLEELDAGEADSRLAQVDVVQPATWALQVALAALWRHLGVEPDAVVGQSLGEVAAAHVAGALSLDDAARIICLRSRLVKATTGQGGMAAVELSLEEARAALEGVEDRLSVAVDNGPKSTVLSGDPGVLGEVLERLEAQGVFCRRVKVDYASHSPQMEPLRDELLHLLRGVRPRPAAVPIYSTVLGSVTDGARFDAGYWADNLREPVLFAGCLEQLLDDGHDVFVEVSAHPIVSSAITQALHHWRREGVVLPSMRRGEERAVVLGSLGALYTIGYPVGWAKLHPAGGRCLRLPTYPWQRQSFWLEGRPMGSSPAWVGYGGRGGRNPLLGRHLRSAVHASTHFWQTELSATAPAYLADHRVQDAVVLPATAYLEMALSAAAESLGGQAHVLEAVRFDKALFLPEDTKRTVQLAFTREPSGAVAFRVFSDEGRGGGEPLEPEGSWTLHVAGTLRPASGEAPEHESVAAVRQRCPEEVSGRQHYRAMEERGLLYGATFQGVEQVWRRDGEAVGRVRLVEALAPEAPSYQVHPALLDACFQMVAGAVPADDGGTWLPVAVGSLRLYGRPGPRLWCHVALRAAEGDGDRYEGDAVLLDEERVVLEARGLELQRLERDARPARTLEDLLFRLEWRERTEPASEPPPAPETPGAWVVLSDGGGVGRALAGLLEASGEACAVVRPLGRKPGAAPGEHLVDAASPADYHRLLASAGELFDVPCRGVVHLWSLDATALEETSPPSLDEDQVLGSVSLACLVQALAGSGWSEPPSLFVVTRAAQPAGEPGEPVAAAQSGVWGLGRVLAHEQPELSCRLIDLDPQGAAAAAAEALWREIRRGGQESQVALRGEQRYVARLAGAGPGESSGSPEPARQEHVEVAFGEQSYRLEAPGSGVLDDLALRGVPRREPGPGEIEVQVFAAGLNFKDVMRALGVFPGQPEGVIPLGMECAGRVTAVGEGVGAFAVGDEVVAATPSTNCSFSSFARVAASCAVRKPAALGFAEAVSLPIAFVTAYYAMIHLGRLSAGERVLIHSASGGVGLAAVQLARHCGAQVFATAGSPEKRDFLRSLGVEHVMDSRSLAFAEQVTALTGGEGVDMVLNSLAGEAIPRGLAVLRSCGRFLEIGKRDIAQNSQIGLLPFDRNLSFFAIDMDRMARERPEFIGSLLGEMVKLLAEGTLEPLPHEVFPISEALAAFRHLAQARHIGKVVLSFEEPRVRVCRPAAERSPVHRDAGYLVTGGLGGLGLAVAEWLVGQGARHLALVGRSAPSGAAAEAIERLREAGAQVLVVRADVAEQDQVENALDEVRRRLPALRGLVHAAGVLDDGIVLQLDRERFRTVMAPKVRGAWNLHTSTAGLALDFFVLFSSAASLLGSPGQGNYSAANAFLDGLAWYRRARGLPALSVNWGPWSDVGLAARPDRGGRLAQRGLDSITPRQGVEALARLLGRDDTQVAVMPFEARRWQQFYPAAATLPLFEELVDPGAAPQPAAAGRTDREAIVAAAPARRRDLLESYLRDLLGRVLGLATAEIDLREPLNKLGIDSLMAIEVKNRIDVDLGVAVPTVHLLQGPSVVEMARKLAAELGTGSDPDPGSVPLTAEVEGGSDPAGQELSFTQERIWFADRLDRGKGVYDLAAAVTLDGPLEARVLHRASSEVVRRHAVLRSRFVEVDGRPLQVPEPPSPVEMPAVDLEGLPEDAQRAEIGRLAAGEGPLDLAAGRPMRFALARRSGRRHVLVVRMHHIVIDRWSSAVFFQELARLYHDFATRGSSSLPELPVQYADFARWQRRWLRGEVLESGLDYWRRHLAGAPEHLPLPVDHPRPRVRSRRGGRHPVALPAGLSEEVRTLARREDATVFMTLLAVFNLLLARYAEQDDVVVGVNVANRTHKETEGLIGCFVNTLPLRTDLAGDPTFRELLARVREAVLGGVAHQQVPYEKVVKTQQAERDLSRSPLFQVVFDFGQVRLAAKTLEPGGGLKMKIRSLDGYELVRWDLQLYMAEHEDGLRGEWTYAADLFEPATIARVHGHFETLLRNTTARPGARLSDLEMYTETEKEHQGRQEKTWQARSRERLLKAKPKTVEGLDADMG